MNLTYSFLLRNSRTRLCWVLLLVVLTHFGLGHGLSNWVVCFGADGHIAVEQAHHEHLKSLAQHSAKWVESDLAQNLEQAPCTDIPVAADDHCHSIPQITPAKTTLDFGILPLFFMALCVVQSARVIAKQPLPELPFVDTRLLSLRTIVLLN